MSQDLTLHQQNVSAFRQLAESPAYMNRFKQVLNDRAPQFIASLTQVVSSSTYLAKCQPNSIMAAAITAAALDLPIDKNLGFAHIVPYKDQATFQMGYKGFIQLAVRTGQYRFLNCCVVHDGELEKYDELTGEIVISTKARKSDEVIGYAAYFKLMNGYEHGEFWTKKDVEDHARKFSQAFKSNYDTPWKTNFDAMALKTVIKSLLSHWGIMSIEMQAMRTAMLNDQGARTSIDSNDIAYPDTDPKRPALTGPTEPTDPAETAKQANVVSDAIDAASIEKPYDFLCELAKKDGVTPVQVHAWMKANKLAGEKTTELLDTSDSNMRKVISTWPAVLPAIKKLHQEG